MLSAFIALRRATPIKFSILFEEPECRGKETFYEP